MPVEDSEREMTQSQVFMTYGWINYSIVWILTSELLLLLSAVLHALNILSPYACSLTATHFTATTGREIIRTVLRIGDLLFKKRLTPQSRLLVGVNKEQGHLRQPLDTFCLCYHLHMMNCFTNGRISCGKETAAPHTQCPFVLSLCSERSFQSDQISYKSSDVTPDWVIWQTCKADFLKCWIKFKNRCTWAFIFLFSKSTFYKRRILLLCFLLDMCGGGREKARPLKQHLCAALYRRTTNAIFFFFCAQFMLFGPK